MSGLTASDLLIFGMLGCLEMLFLLTRGAEGFGGQRWGETVRGRGRREKSGEMDVREHCGLDGGTTRGAGTRPVGRIGGRIAQTVWEGGELLSKAKRVGGGRAKELMETAALASRRACDGRRHGRKRAAGCTHVAETTAPHGGSAGGLRDRRLMTVNGFAAARPSLACFLQRAVCGRRLQELRRRRPDALPKVRRRSSLPRFVFAFGICGEALL